jgi:hypothetical protein
VQILDGSLGSDVKTIWKEYAQPCKLGPDNLVTWGKNLANPARFVQNWLLWHHVMKHIYARWSVACWGERNIRFNQLESVPQGVHRLIVELGMRLKVDSTVHEVLQGRLGADWSFRMQSLILVFQVSHLFPVCAELFLAKWGHVTASNLRNGVM